MRFQTYGWPGHRSFNVAIGGYLFWIAFNRVFGVDIGWARPWRFPTATQLEAEAGKQAFNDVFGPTEAP